MGGWESYGVMMLVTDGRTGDLWRDDASGRWEEGRVLVV
jgi:hypothetical protein